VKPLLQDLFLLRRRSQKYIMFLLSEHGTYGASYVCEISLKNGDNIEIHVNEDPEEKKLELMSKEPLLWYSTEFDEKLLKAGMKRELQSLKDFEVFEEVETSNLSEQQVTSAIPTGWVHKAKGLEVKSRVVVRGYAEQVSDPDDTYASTPSFTTLKLLLTLAISRTWFVMGADVSTAFLHALWTKDETFIVPPAEFYPEGGVLWRLRKALYGLKSSPKLWQTHFASTMSKFDFERCKSDANLYRHVDGDLYVLCYVDDLLIVGEKSRVDSTFALLSSELVMKNTGTLCEENDKRNFLGRQLTRTADSSILISMDPTYVAKILEESGMSKCRAANTPGTEALKRKIEDEYELSREDHSAYRKLVGQLLWLAPVRPDIAYGVKELSRGVSSPTAEHLSKAKHLLRYLSGTRDYCLELKPKLYLNEKNTNLTITVHTDSDWAGCTSTRKSTSGVLCSVLGVSISALSRTQQTLALSSGEAELYALGLGVSEALFIKSLVLEAQFAKTCHITLYTDSTAGKSMSNRWGTTRKTKHIELRFLFVQELITSGVVVVKKVLGTLNPADILTKYVSREILERHLSSAGVLVRHLTSRPIHISCVHFADRTTYLGCIHLCTFSEHVTSHVHTSTVIIYDFNQTLFDVHTSEAQLADLAQYFWHSQTLLSAFPEMNTSKMDKFTYVKDLKLRASTSRSTTCRYRSGTRLPDATWWRLQHFLFQD